VTTAPEPEPEIPWMQPTTELPAQPTSRRRLIVLLLPVVGLLVLCCGGAALTTSFFRGDKPRTGQPTLVIPSSAAPQPPAPTASPSPSPSARPTSKAPTTHPTTHRPRPTTARPTTTRPKPSPSATSGMIQQNVRVGQFCAPRGAIGVTRHGQVLHCGPSVDDPRSRWRPL
jgi:cytoskeletal protein RodZ